MSPLWYRFRYSPIHSLPPPPPPRWGSQQRTLMPFSRPTMHHREPFKLNEWVRARRKSKYSKEELKFFEPFGERCPGYRRMRDFHLRWISSIVRRSLFLALNPPPPVWGGGVWERMVLLADWSGRKHFWCLVDEQIGTRNCVYRCLFITFWCHDYAYMMY